MKKKFSMIKMIAFDIGDTLYRVSHPELLQACWNEEMRIMREKGLKFSDEGYKLAAERAWRESQKVEYKSDSLSVPKLVQQYLGFKVNEELAKNMSAAFLKVAQKYKVEKKHIIDGTIETITYLHKKGYLLGIISDTETDWAKNWVKELGVNYFEIYSLSFQVGGKKASLKPFIHFLNEAKSKYSINAEEIVMIGDLSVDMDAKKLGMKAILFNPIEQDTKHFEYKPDAIIKHLLDLKSIL
ncbi:MAG: HAD family hydrolase [archaeon]|jgi:HAD superfamily hydrolase (TIGR01549 family)